MKSARGCWGHELCNLLFQHCLFGPFSVGGDKIPHGMTLSVFNLLEHFYLTLVHNEVTGDFFFVKSASSDALNSTVKRDKVNGSKKHLAFASTLPHTTNSVSLTRNLSSFSSDSCLHVFITIYEVLERSA